MNWISEVKRWDGLAKGNTESVLKQDRCDKDWFPETVKSRMQYHCFDNTKTNKYRLDVNAIR